MLQIEKTLHFSEGFLGKLAKSAIFRGMGEVVCPSCGEAFFVPVPALAECPAEMDYDCEVCCRPFVLVIDENGQAESRGTDEGFGS